jgi:hypothetical protein
LIFERYLKLGSVNLLVRDLGDRGLISKVRHLSTGATRGGVPFTQGPLFYMLRNRFYVGEVNFKGEILPGQQPALLERELFDAVQARLTEQRSHRTTSRVRSRAPLSGLLFDDAGNEMIATHATKNRVRYRYYISRPLQRGHSQTRPGTVSRVPAEAIEAAITEALRDRARESDEQSPENPDRDVIAAHVTKIEVRNKALAVQLREPPASRADFDGEPDATVRQSPVQDLRSAVIMIPWTKPPAKKFREIIQPASPSTHRVRPIRAERRAGLIRALARSRSWLDEIVAGTVTVEDLAARQGCSVRQINLTLSMAFIAPALSRAAIEGRLPRGIGIAQLRDPPAEWSQQFARLGLPQV